MRVITFLLGLVAFVVVLAVLAVSVRMAVGSRFDRHDWQSWVVTESHDAVILSTGFRSRTVTVCNRSFSRRGEGSEDTVIVRRGRGDRAEDIALPYRGCTTVTSSRIEVRKPDGERFDARGRYKIDRGDRDRSYRGMRHRGGMMAGRKDRDSAAGDQSTDDADAGAPADPATDAAPDGADE